MVFGQHDVIRPARDGCDVSGPPLHQLQQLPPMNSDDIDEAGSSLSRREFVRLLGASMALAGAAGCVREPSEPILPFVHPPDLDVTGEVVHYATAMTLDGYATGLLVAANDGRPIKIEGNPKHPRASAPVEFTIRRRCCSCTIRIARATTLGKAWRGGPTSHRRSVLREFGSAPARAELDSAC